MLYRFQDISNLSRSDKEEPPSASSSSSDSGLSTGKESRLVLPVSFGPSGKGRLCDPIQFVLDTGAVYPFVISRVTLERHGLRDLEIVGKAKAETVHGLVELDVVRLDMSIRTQSNDSPIFVETPVVVSESDNIVGRSVLALYDYTVEAGKLRVFKPNQEAFSKLKKER